MTLHSPDTAARPPLPLGRPSGTAPATADDGQAPALDAAAEPGPHPQHEATPPPGDVRWPDGAPPVGPGLGHRRGRPDYRLRGLDLGGQGVVDEPRRPEGRRPPATLRVRRRRRRRLLTQWAVVVAVAVAVAVGLRATVVEPYTVSSAAMTPTLQAGERVLVVKAGVAGRIRRGDIVVFRMPAGAACPGGGSGGPDLVARVIGLPGETIGSIGGTVYVDGRRLVEPSWYDHRSGPTGSTPVPLTTIPAGRYFVMGDDRADACDSRAFGSIPASAVVGRVVATYLRDGHPYVHGL